ncbi:MAG: hypothetical protein IRZ13_21175 [Acetobacteraceae bacterium]|nr:hypothetical protein [Acetobacteraceae bacterium]
MTSFRSLLAGLGALAVASSPALAAPEPACLRPPEQTALELRALQSRLMVGAVACRQEDAYNAFVRRFQRELGSAYNQAEGHFRRIHGGQGRTRFNQFDTQLANAQSEENNRHGAFFCRDTQVFFREAMALDSAQLAKFGVERNIVLPYEAPTCSQAETTRPARSRPARAARTTSAASARHR